jgi:hypothetical protein
LSSGRAAFRGGERGQQEEQDGRFKAIFTLNHLVTLFKKFAFWPSIPIFLKLLRAIQ